MDIVYKTTAVVFNVLLCLWGAAAKSVVVLAPVQSFDVYSDVVGGKEELQAISAWISSLCFWVARERALDAAQKQNFLVLFACIANYLHFQQPE